MNIRHASALPSVAAPDVSLAGIGLTRRALHELHAAGSAEASAALGCALVLLQAFAGGRPMLWVWHEALEREIGRPFLPGLADLGPGTQPPVLVRVRRTGEALQAGLEGARSPAAGAVLISLWGPARELDLTASRRLALAARASGTTVLLLQTRAAAAPSAAETRWQVAPAASRALAAAAPGPPAFHLRLLRHRAGLQQPECCVDWNRDDVSLTLRGRERPPLSGAVVPAARLRAGAAGGDGLLRRAG